MSAKDRSASNDGPEPRALRSQLGQGIVVVALAGTLLIGGAGLAVDMVVGYFYAVDAEGAAAAAALSGVGFMPDQFNPSNAIPAGCRNDSTDASHRGA